MALFLKNLIFTIVVPGTVAGFVPWYWFGALGPIASGWTLALGGVVVLAGLALYVACVLPFAIVGRGTPAPIDAPVHLVVVGPYRFVRNPMYIAVLLVIFGQAIMSASSSLALYGTAVFVTFVAVVVVYEEPTLRRQFGEQYREYCTRVPRWVPRIPKGQHP